MNILDKLLGKKAIPAEHAVGKMVNDAMTDLETGGYTFNEYHKKEWRQFLTDIANCTLSGQMPDEGDKINERYKNFDNAGYLYQLSQRLAALPVWWEGDAMHRSFIEKTIIMGIRHGQPMPYEINNFIYGNKYSPPQTTPNGYAEFVFEQWLLEKNRIAPSFETVGRFYELIYTFRQRESEWLPRFEAEKLTQMKRLLASLGLEEPPFGREEENSLREFSTAYRTIYNAMSQQGKWKEAQKLPPDTIPEFQEILQKPLAFRVNWVHLLVFYRHFSSSGFYEETYKLAAKQLISSEFSYADLIWLTRLPDAPHTDLVRTLAQKQKKAPLPPDFVAWLATSSLLSKYQKLMDTHIAVSDSNAAGEVSREALLNSGFRSTIESGDYNYAHAQTRFRAIQEWSDDVLLLLSQVCEVQILGSKQVAPTAQYAWQEEPRANYSLRFPDGQTRTFDTTMTDFCTNINRILQEIGNNYRLSCQDAKTTKTAWRHTVSANATHVRLVTRWMLDEFPEIFPETPQDLFFEEKNPAERAPVFLKSLAEVKKGRAAAQRSGAAEDILSDIRFAHFVETVVEKTENAEAVKPLAALLLGYTGGAKPSEKWVTKIKETQNTLGKEVYVNTLLYFLDNIYRVELWYEDSRLGALKGMLWALSFAPTRPSLNMIRQVIEYAYAKVPGKGPRATGLGEAGMKVLAESGAPEAFGQLVLMRAKTKYPRFKKQLEKYIQTYCKKTGLSEQELEDRTVDDFGLKNGKIEQMIGDYAVVLSVEDYKAHANWYDAKGKEMKSAPSALKTKHATELKNLQMLQKGLQQTLSTQRQRLDRNWIDNRSWTWEIWEPGFRSHELMRLFAEKIIWEFDLGTEKITGMGLPDVLLHPNGPVHYPAAESIKSIRVWHPATASVEETLAWRNFLMEKQWRQPFKQAFREIYLLTEAELTTVDHSNRFAGHILKTNNLLAIAPQREWDFVYEHYDCAFPKRHLPAWGLRADYDLVQAPLGGVSPTGRLHFQKTGSDTSWVNLIDVPPLVFSEILRDVDMFVAVTSIGSDPNWRINGHDQENYWRNYAYGSLSQTQGAEERKKILEMMIPRTKLAKNAAIEGNFVVVQGKHRTYKINIGSGNILMEPNDQYLCIVPAPSQVTQVENKVWLPFEGDSLLTLVLSKAFLLAEDDKITDGSILSQIKHK